jgi:hypothetical protein
VAAQAVLKLYGWASSDWQRATWGAKRHFAR